MGHMKRLNERTDCARAALGDQGIYRHWAAYAREHPDRVFESESRSEPKRGAARQRVTRKARSGDR